MRMKVKSREFNAIFHLFTKKLYTMIVQRLILKHIGVLQKFRVLLASTKQEIGDFVIVPVLKQVINYNRN